MAFDDDRQAARQQKPIAELDAGLRTDFMPAKAKERAYQSLKDNTIAYVVIKNVVRNGRISLKKSQLELQDSTAIGCSPKAPPGHAIVHCGGESLSRSRCEKTTIAMASFGLIEETEAAAEGFESVRSLSV